MWRVFVWKAFERGCEVNLALLRMISKLLFCAVSTCESPFILLKGWRKETVWSPLTQISIVCAQLVHTHTQILRSCCIYYQDLGWKLRLHGIWIWSFVCICLGGVYVGHFASEACAFACRPGEGTWALIILAVSSPHNVVKSAEPECDELFTSAVFHPRC